MIYHETGESIEAEKCNVIARKLNVSSYLDIQNVGKVLKYDGKLNCEAEIIEELDPKKFKYKLTSYLDSGSKLKAKDIFLYSKVFRKPPQQLINKSGRHKSQHYCFKKYTFAEIKTPLQNVINSMKKRKTIK